MPRTAKKTRRIYVPRETFIAPYNGDDVTFIRGRTKVAEGHSILEQFGHLFEEIRVDYDVEQATANPGELR